MILHPAALALILTALIVAGFALYACCYGVRILSGWNMASGSEKQLELERRTYLISTIMSWALICQLLSLFLFIYTGDALHDQFTGAMCAAGVININGFGYPLLLLKIGNFILAGVWLVLNHADSHGYDYPLIKAKYILLNLLTPLLALEAGLIIAFFAGIRPDVITSCCGSLFSADTPRMTGTLAGLPARPMIAAFYTGMGVTAISGGYFCIKGRGAYLFAAASCLTFIISAASLVSFICLYFYELLTHHCPFCILQKEYGYVGYLLYATLVVGGVAGLSTGALTPFEKQSSMLTVIPSLQRRLATVTLTCYLLFTLIVSWRMLFTSFKLGIL